MRTFRALLAVVLGAVFASVAAAEGASDPFVTFSSEGPFSARLVRYQAGAQTDPTFQYSTDKETWTDLTIGWGEPESMTASWHDGKYCLFLRGRGNTCFTTQWGGTVAGYFHIELDGSNGIVCSGNAEMLLNYETAASGNHPTMDPYCFYHFFENCEKLISIPDLPATELTDHCYDGMFSGCSWLRIETQAPGQRWSIPAAQTLGVLDWNLNMFSGTGGAFVSDPQPGVQYYIASAPITEHRILTDCGENGVLTVDAEWMQAGETVTASVSPAVGYELESITVVQTEGTETVPTTKVDDGTYTFVMPAYPVTVSARFAAIPPPSENECLTFACDQFFKLYMTPVNDEPEMEGQPVELPPANLEYSYDGRNWMPWEGRREANALSAQQDASSMYKIYLRGYENTGFREWVDDDEWGALLTDSVFVFVNDDGSDLDADVECSGDIATLLDYNEVAVGRRPEVAAGCFSRMFQNSPLRTVPSLGSVTVSEDCFRWTFAGCRRLVELPSDLLPSMQLYSMSYMHMFMDCSSLVNTPDLPALQMAYCCYLGMFENCDSLTKTPELPATGLYWYCYQQMFMNCDSLVEISDLPATALSGCCYQWMFAGCTSLQVSTTAPGKRWSIPAEAVEERDWNVNMFAGTGGTFTGSPQPGVQYYIASAPADYPILIEESEDAKIGASAESARAGETVTVWADPAVGYVLETISVVQTDGTETVPVTRVSEHDFTFVMPAYGVTVSAKLVADAVTLGAYDYASRSFASAAGTSAKRYTRLTITLTQEVTSETLDLPTVSGYTFNAGLSSASVYVIDIAEPGKTSAEIALEYIRAVRFVNCVSQWMEIRLTAADGGTMAFDSEVRSLTVTFDANGGVFMDGENEEKTKDVAILDADKGYLMPSPLPVNEGYYISSWCTNLDDVAGSTVMPFDALLTESDHTVYAVWESAAYHDVACTNESGTAVNVKIPDAWAAARGLDPDDPDYEAKVLAEAARVEGNGQPAWVNMVTGLDPEKELETTFRQNTSTGSVSVIAGNVKKQMADTGLEVKYEVYRVSGDCAGLEASSEYPNNLQIGLNAGDGVPAVESNRHYRIRIAVNAPVKAPLAAAAGGRVKRSLSANGNSGKEIKEIVSENTMGVLQVKEHFKEGVRTQLFGMPELFAVCIPYGEFSNPDSDISISTLFKTSNMTNGDKAYVYDPNTKSYTCWRLVKSSKGQWERETTTKLNANMELEEVAAGSDRLPRGISVWLWRQKHNDNGLPIFLHGQVMKSNDVKTRVEKYDKVKKIDGWSLVGNPFDDQLVDLDVQFPAGDGKYDNCHVMVPFGNAPLNYWVRNGKWGYWRSEDVMEGTKKIGVRNVFVYDAKVFPGIGGWFVDGDGNYDQIDWIRQ